ncbi:hypothetical protein NQ314_007461 [Rhamnusium bicolor]|uniref:Nucleolar protein 9 n=1 Tax=Rhamnusium bicolor TaxID=1586634 RepID=A0AAV8YPI0_9CUCU|nr:hypothetical protein NQ314_007461 [Rhamnusium bicolor]
MSSVPTNNRNKRKKKKSFLKNARKYAKRGYYGRGSELDADTYQYFVRIMETYREGFDNDEDKIVFANNVFEQTENIEFMDAFTSDLRKLCNDRFASHVLEALVIQSCRKSSEDSGTSQDFIQYFKEFTIKISKFLLNNLEDYIWDTYANHVIRTCLENLVQLTKDEKNSEGNIKGVGKQIIPKEYPDIVKDYGERLIAWPQFVELCTNELTSGFLQVLLKCLDKVDLKLLKRYLKKLLNEVFAPNAEEYDSKLLPQAFLSRSSIMLLEAAIQISSPKMFTQIYAKCFAGKLFYTEKVEFEAIFDELTDHFEAIIDAGHSGIILCLAQSCKRLCAKQGSFVQNIMKTFHCFEPEERQQHFVMCMSRFDKYEVVEKQSNENLKKRQVKPSCLLGMEQTDLKDLFSNSMGSHIVDSYVKGLFVGEKSKEKLVRKMMGTYQELASSKYGSRSFEAIWNAANLKAKLHIMAELAHKDGAWSNSECGKIIANKVNLLLYKRNKEDWKNSLSKTKNSEDILADIFK